jgi:dihydroflavonol-4-reductase
MVGITQLVQKIAGSKVSPFIIPAKLVSAIAPFIGIYYRLMNQPVLFTGMSMDTICGYHNISHNKATRDLGYNPRPFRHTIADTLAWFKQNGYI